MLCRDRVPGRACRICHRKGPSESGMTSTSSSWTLPHPALGRTCKPGRGWSSTWSTSCPDGAIGSSALSPCTWGTRSSRMQYGGCTAGATISGRSRYPLGARAGGSAGLARVLESGRRAGNASIVARAPNSVGSGVRGILGAGGTISGIPLSLLPNHASSPPSPRSVSEESAFAASQADATAAPACDLLWAGRECER